MIILALDDEAGALRLLKRAIASARPEAEIYAFQEVMAALKFAETAKIDIAFLDIQMPVMSGLEAARRIKKSNPDVNVIFTTGFSEYAVDAIKIRSSGYLLKPVTRADVEQELENLRNPVADTKETSGIRIRTFGSFDIFIDGKPLAIRRERAKEMLAYLVYRRGSSVTRKELAAVIFEDREYTRTTQTYLTQIIGSLRQTLEEAGIADLLVCEYNTYAVDPGKFTCDSYEYLDGDPAAVNQFRGEYMNQYSWAEELTYQFYK